VLNSKNFGVPQNRERVFIVGHIRGTSRPEVFPIGESDLKSLGGGQGAKTGLYAIPVLTPDRVEKRQNGRRMKKNGEPGFTLTGQDIHGVYDGFRIRRLTPTECERLQGFPDGWTSGISDSQRYKCLGNAVTVNVIKAIGMKLLVKSIRQYETYNTLG
jgi:DNA (cytosine-5)-methyltransferase 1